MEARTVSKKRLRVSAAIVFGIVFLGWALPARSQSNGHLEFGFHYSRWSINLLHSVVEGYFSDALKTDMKDLILERIRADYPSLEETGYRQDLQFDSIGDNFGFEVRYYPGGKYGTFSFGLSFEKTTMRISLPEVSVSMSLNDGHMPQDVHFGAASAGHFFFKPWSLHLSFRWDMHTSSVVHPYFTLGVGAATVATLEKAEVSYSYAGDLLVPGEATTQYSDSVKKSVKELKDEMEAKGESFFIPGFVPFIQLNLGLKAIITPNVHLLIDAGVWNGFIVRVGVAFRI